MQLLFLLSGLSLLSQALSIFLPPEYSIKASSDGRHFVTARGDPFFWQADTAWALFHRLTFSEAETYLSDRASKGFNMILAVAVTQFGPTNPNRAGDLPLVNLDPTKPNEPYWKYVDDIVQLAWKKGIRIAMVPAWGNTYFHSDANTAGIINTTNAHAFGTWIGKRYPGLPKILVADTNSYWTNKTAVKIDYASGGVHEPYKYLDWSPVYDDLASGLIAGEGKDAMITTHCTNQWFTGGPIALASAFFGNRKWLTFDTSQSGHASYPPNPPIPWWNAKRGWEPVGLMYAAIPKRPVLDNEAHYENRYDNGKSINPYWNASDIRTGSYQAVFAGAAGLTYGADNVMQFYMPGLYSPSGSGPAQSWVIDIGLPGSSQMQYIRRIISDRANNGTGRIPDQSIIVGKAGADDKHVVATRDVKGGWLAVYTPTGNPFTLRTETFQFQKEVKASWFNPLDGTYKQFNWTLAVESIFTPPTGMGHVDWVLVLEAQ